MSSPIPPPPGSASPVAPPREGMIKVEETFAQKVAARGRSLVPDRDDWVDLGFSAILVAACVLGFSTAFFGWSWVVAGTVGLLVGLVVAHLVTAFRLPAVVSLVAIGAAYFLLGGPVAVRGDLIAGFIPSGQTFRDLASTLVHGWKQLLTMLPPIDSVGPLVALPLVIALVGSVVTYTVARRWTNPYAVVLAPLGLLAVSIALGTLQPADRLLQGAAFGVTSVVWMVARAARNRAPLQNGAGQRTRAAIGTGLIAASAVVAGVVGPMLPGAQAEDRDVVRNLLTPPFDIAQFPSPLAGFRKYTEPNPAKLFDAEILSVDGLPAGTPLRFATLDSYDDAVWGAGARASLGSGSPGTSFQQVASRVANPAAAQGTTTTVTVSVPEGGYTDAWLPTAGAITGVRFAGPRAESLQERLWLNISTETAIVPARVQPGDAYSFDAVLPATPTALPQSVPLATGSLVQDVDLSYLDARVDAWTGRESDPWAQVVAAAKDMQSQGTYTDGGTPNSYERVYLPGHSSGRLARFVGSSQLAGDDEQYAATLALVAGRLGIPARVVMGAIVPEGGQVKGKDVHAWVEVQAADGSWVEILPQEFVPDRSKKPSEQRLKTEEQKVGALVPPPAGVNPPSVLQGPDQAQAASNIKKPARTFFDPSSWPTWVRVLVFWVVVPLLSLVALYWVIRGLKFWRRRRQSTRGPTTHRIAWAWEDLVSSARSYGMRIPRRATRLEQTALVAERVAVEPLAASANAAIFGPGEPTDEQAADYWSQIRAARRELRSHSDLRRKLLADLDPRPIFARRPRSGSARDAARLLPSRLSPSRKATAS